MYETDSFFETITAKMYGEVNNFSVSPWSVISNESEASFRTMHYEFPQAWAFSKVRNYHGCMAFSTFYSVYYTINLNIPFTNLNYLLSFKYTMYVDQDQSKCDWCSPGRAYGVDSG